MPEKTERAALPLAPGLKDQAIGAWPASRGRCAACAG